MPDSGEVRPVQASQGADSQVRVFGVPPRDGAQPAQIVDGFMEAMASDDPQLATARKYLTKRASKAWKPGAGVTVLAAAPGRQPERSIDKESVGARFKLTGKQVAGVDERRAYQPQAGAGDYEEHLQLVKDGKEWRIDALPDGLVLAESDFQRIFQPVNKYYFAADKLVADPVYVRQRQDPESRMDPMTQTVKALLEGPTKWLAPVVTSSFPTGSGLKPGTTTLTYGGQNVLKVPLNDKASNVAQTQCTRMATQLLFTMADLTSSRVDRVELLRSDDSPLCDVDEALAEVTAHQGSRRADHQYFVDSEHRLVRMQARRDSESKPAAAEPVAGPLTSAGLQLSTVAVAHDEKRAAAVPLDRRSLYVASLTTDGPLGKPVLTSAARQLSAPSWDGRGDLWVADRDPAKPVLWRLPGGTGKPQAVDVAGLAGGRVEAIRVSADGVRIALLVSSKDGRKTLQTGRVERRGSGSAATVSVRELRPAAPRMADVTAMSWASRGRLLVVGRESGGLLQVRYMHADGSATTSGNLPGATGVTAIAASEDERLPVVAHSEEDGIVWLPPGAQWKTVVEDGAAPVYPG
ncbi:LpqB family beta-propeller domain-containing protein [Streptomyces sp. A3M-1-3]|nr:LpqB family beta-propeller domain-containing protein [Streptomyces sp. A3M-1-3]MCP3822147.1 LpqB family beta-propeller domain-containing protein [Streptomyces sp. A3M-1-3]